MAFGQHVILVTKNDFVVMASEVGVLDIPPADIVVSGRLEPGKLFFIDTQAGRIIDDEAGQRDLWLAVSHMELWLKDNLFRACPIQRDRAVKNRAW